MCCNEYKQFGDMSAILIFCDTQLLFLTRSVTARGQDSAHLARTQMPVTIYKEVELMFSGVIPNTISKEYQFEKRCLELLDTD